MKKTFSLLMAILLLVGCAGQARFQPTTKSDNYSKKINSELLVIFETSHLVNAYAQIGDTSGQWPATAARAVVNQLRIDLEKQGIQVAGETINSTLDSAAFPRAIGKHRGKKQILTIQASAFQTSQTTRYGAPIGSPVWNGNVQWTLRLFDMDKEVNPDGKAVWTAKTDNVQFGRACTNNNARYGLCADRFVSAIVSQLSTDGLLQKK